MKKISINEELSLMMLNEENEAYDEFCAECAERDEEKRMAILKKIAEIRKTTIEDLPEMTEDWDLLDWEMLECEAEEY